MGKERRNQAPTVSRCAARGMDEGHTAECERERRWFRNGLVAQERDPGIDPALVSAAKTAGRRACEKDIPDVIDVHAPAILPFWRAELVRPQRCAIGIEFGDVRIGG